MAEGQSVRRKNRLGMEDTTNVTRYVCSRLTGIKARGQRTAGRYWEIWASTFVSVAQSLSIAPLRTWKERDKSKTLPSFGSKLLAHHEIDTRGRRRRFSL